MKQLYTNKIKEVQARETTATATLDELCGQESPWEEGFRNHFRKISYDRTLDAYVGLQKSTSIECRYRVCDEKNRKKPTTTESSSSNEPRVGFSACAHSVRINRMSHIVHVNIQGSEEAAESTEMALSVQWTG